MRGSALWVAQRLVLLAMAFATKQKKRSNKIQKEEKEAPVESVHSSPRRDDEGEGGAGSADTGAGPRCSPSSWLGDDKRVSAKGGSSSASVNVAPEIHVHLHTGGGSSKDKGPATYHPAAEKAAKPPGSTARFSGDFRTKPAEESTGDRVRSKGQAAWATSREGRPTHHPFLSTEYSGAHEVRGRTLQVFLATAPRFPCPPSSASSRFYVIPRSRERPALVGIWCCHYAHLRSLLPDADLERVKGTFLKGFDSYEEAVAFWDKERPGKPFTRLA